MTEFISVLKSIVEDKELDFFVMDERNVNYNECKAISKRYFERFQDVYTRIDRHEYSKVARYVRTLQADQLSELSRKIMLILDCTKEQENSKDKKAKESYRKLLKLLDHVDLQIVYLSETGRVDAIATEINASKGEMFDKVEEVKNVFVEARKETKNLKAQVISILGIFSGIVVAFSFSISTIGEALSNLTDKNIFNIAFLVFVLGIVFVNTISLLMVFIAKMSGFSLNNETTWKMYLLVNVILVVGALASLLLIVFNTVES